MLVISVSFSLSTNFSAIQTDGGSPDIVQRKEQEEKWLIELQCFISSTQWELCYAARLTHACLSEPAGNLSVHSGEPHADTKSDSGMQRPRMIRRQGK